MFGLIDIILDWLSVKFCKKKASSLIIEYLFSIAVFGGLALFVYGLVEENYVIAVIFAVIAVAFSIFWWRWGIRDFKKWWQERVDEETTKSNTAQN